ncbi:MAG: hypothetical protein HONBIEJF_02660 [Fimbriimonadaceae bacterium]|nr:hypothetical protein [Fimbriimonadaceae bacterium]
MLLTGAKDGQTVGGMNISIQRGLEGVAASDLDAFDMLGGRTGYGRFLLAMLQGSEGAFIAKVEDEVVGYAAVIGDGFAFAFLTAMEVKADLRAKGIGSALLATALDAFAGRYAFDLACDEGMAAFYERFDFVPATAMIRRNYEACRLNMTTE